MVPLAWSEGRIAVRAVEAAQTPALHAAFRECADAASLDPTFAEVPASEIGELVERSAADASQERGFRMRSIHVGPAGELAGYFHLMEHVPAAGDVWLSILAIRPRFRRSGVGTAVIASLRRCSPRRDSASPWRKSIWTMSRPCNSGWGWDSPKSSRIVATTSATSGRNPVSSCGHRSTGKPVPRRPGCAAASGRADSVALP